MAWTQTPPRTTGRPRLNQCQRLLQHERRVIYYCWSLSPFISHQVHRTPYPTPLPHHAAEWQAFATRFGQETSYPTDSAGHRETWWYDWAGAASPRGPATQELSVSFQPVRAVLLTLSKLQSPGRHRCGSCSGVFRGSDTRLGYRLGELHAHHSRRRHNEPCHQDCWDRPLLRAGESK